MVIKITPTISWDTTYTDVDINAAAMQWINQQIDKGDNVEVNHDLYSRPARYIIHAAYAVVTVDVKYITPGSWARDGYAVSVEPIATMEGGAQ